MHSNICMKKRNQVIAIAVLFFSNPIWAQKKLTEATITYDIVINTNNTTPKAADLLDGATSIIYLKGNSSRSEMISSMGSKSTIIVGKINKVTILKDYGEQKYMISLSQENWKASNKKYEGINCT